MTSSGEALSNSWLCRSNASKSFGDGLSRSPAGRASGPPAGFQSSDAPGQTKPVVASLILLVILRKMQVSLIGGPATSRKEGCQAEAED
jgi:hypothetical protein